MSTIEHLINIEEIFPAKINNKIYNDNDISSLASDIKRDGILEWFVISKDKVIISGHRRRLACLKLGIKKIPYRIFPILSTDPKFPELLVAFNNQRKKSADEIFREEVVRLNPEATYMNLLEYRIQQGRVNIEENVDVLPRKTRSKISAARQPFCEAVKKVFYKYKTFLPVTDRRVHYALLNDPPKTSIGKAGFAYGNNPKSYSALSRLLTVMRLQGIIPFEWMTDTTRPYEPNSFYMNVGGYVDEGILQKFDKGYWRNLTQSQPNFIQVVVEKMTVQGLVSGICQKYCVPMLVARGHSSIDARYAISKAFRQSGRDKLVLLILSDFDPSGETIAESFAQSMRDDFGIKNIVASKVALTYDQVQSFNLPFQADAKTTSPTYKNFVRKYGKGCWELEALEPAQLQALLDDAIQSALNLELFQAEVEKEKQESAELTAMKGQMKQFFLGLKREVDL